MTRSTKLDMNIIVFVAFLGLLSMVVPAIHMGKWDGYFAGACAGILLGRLTADK